MASNNDTSVWSVLSAIDCSDHIEKKGQFSFLSWSWAWATLKTAYPDSTFIKHTFESHGTDSNLIKELPYMQDGAGNTYVQCTVAVEGVGATEIYPVLDHKNKSIENPNSFDVNTALQRCLVKAMAYHGLAFYIYQGEDLPQSNEKPAAKQKLYAPLGKSELAKQIKAFTGDVADCDDYDQLIALLNQGKELMKQCERDESFWWFGGEDKHGQEFSGLKERVETAKEKLAKGTN